MFIEDEEKPPGESGAEDDSKVSAAEDDSTDSEEEASDESGEEKEGKKAAKEDVTGKFFDPNKIPKELRPAYNAMQASYTRKMQGAGNSIRKARAFDELVANPEFRAWMEGDTAPKKSKRAADEDGDEEGNSSKGLTAADVEKMVKKAVAEGVGPLLKSEYRKNAKAEWESLIEKFPQAENYKDEIHDVMEEYPGLSYARAFKMVAFDEALGIGEEGAVKKMVKKKNASTESPSRINPGDKPTGKPKSIMDAYKLSKRQLEKAGR